MDKKIENIHVCVKNYNTNPYNEDRLKKYLEAYSKKGYRLVSTQLLVETKWDDEKDRYSFDSNKVKNLYLFFTKET